LEVCLSAKRERSNPATQKSTVALAPAVPPDLPFPYAAFELPLPVALIEKTLVATPPFTVNFSIVKLGSVFVFESKTGLVGPVAVLVQVAVWLPQPALPVMVEYWPVPSARA
jgi:hypothetical protein